MRIPGEEAFEKGFYIKLWVGHDACVEVDVVQAVVPADDSRGYACSYQTCLSSLCCEAAPT